MGDTTHRVSIVFEKFRHIRISIHNMSHYRIYACIYIPFIFYKKIIPTLFNNYANVM